MPKVAVTCQECGKKFYVKPSRIKQGNGKFCSLICYNKNRKGEKNPRWTKIKQVCLECGKEFLAKPSQITYGEGKYCSRTCFGKTRSRNNVGKNNPNWRGGNLKRICKECGTEFYATRAEIKQGSGKYCSKECRSKGFSRLYSGENSTHWKGKLNRICETCGKEFEVFPSRIEWGIAKYCSKICYVKAMPNTFLGEKNPRWLGGISFEPYCPKFNKQFRERVRRWFNFQCVNCGEPEGNKKLTVHHVYYNKKACCEQNENGEYIYNLDGEPIKVEGNPNKFVTLCTSCHSKSNSNRVYWAQYFEDIINTQYNGRSWIDE